MKRISGFTLIDMLTSMLVIIILVATFFSFYIWLNSYMSQYYASSITSSDDLEILVRIKNNFQNSIFVEFDHESKFFEIHTKDSKNQQFRLTDGKYEWLKNSTKLSGRTNINLPTDSIHFYKNTDVVSSIGLLIVNSSDKECYVEVKMKLDAFTKFHLDQKILNEAI